MRRVLLLVTLACSVAWADVDSRRVPAPADTAATKTGITASRTLSKSISTYDELTHIKDVNHSRPCHILKFVLGSRQLNAMLSETKLAVVALLPPHGAGETEDFINRTAEAARIIEQQYRYGKIKFIFTDPQAHIGAFSSQDNVIKALNIHLTKQIKASDIDSEQLRNDHHNYQMDLNDEHHAAHREGRQTSPHANKPFLERLHTHDYPAYVISANGEPKEIWESRSLSPRDLAARVASIANGKLRVLTPFQVAAYALRNPVGSTVVVRHTAKTSQALRVAIAPFAQIIAGDEDFFDNVDKGRFLVIAHKSVNEGLPVPSATKERELSHFFPTEVSDFMKKSGFRIFEVDAYEGGKDSYTHAKTLRRHTLSLSKSKSRSKSLSVEGDSALSEADLVPPTINADVSVGMESLKAIARLVVPAIGRFTHSSMQAVYARAPCIAIAFHGHGVFDAAINTITPELRTNCTFLYSDGGDQKLIASFGFELNEAGDEQKLLIGVHYDHGKYAYRTDMERMPDPQRRNPEDARRDREEKKKRADRADAAKKAAATEDEDSPYAMPDDLEDDDEDVYESKHKRPTQATQVAVPEEDRAPESEPEVGAEDEHHGHHREPPRPRYYVDRVAHRVAPFIKSVLSGKAELYEKTQQFEGELSDPSAIIHGEFFNDFLDTDDIHARMLSDYSRDSFIVVFPNTCTKGQCEDELRVMSTVVGNLDKYRETDAHRSMSIAFYNLSSNALHKHLAPALATAQDATLVFIERMTKFHFFMHNHARYARARFRGGLQFEGHKEEGIIDTETLSLKGASAADIYSFIKRHCRGSEYFIEGNGDNLEAIEYDEL